MTPTDLILTIEEELDDIRIDTAVFRIVDEVPSRSFASKLIGAGLIKLNQKLCKPSAKLKAGDRIFVDLSFLDSASEAPTGEDIPLNLLYEDDDLIVLNKPPGLVVHPGAGVRSGTLVNAILGHCGATLPSLGGPVRAGIVHRLDKDTSGCMVVAKSQRALTGLAAQFADHSQKRIYHALVYGTPPSPEGRIETWHGRDPANRLRYAVVSEDKGKKAILNYQTIKTYCNGLFSLVRCQLFTGRTHQIRVQLTSLGCPLLGDSLYGHPSGKVLTIKPLWAQLKKSLTRQLLHASLLAFEHPATKEMQTFETSLPEDFLEVCQVLEKYEQLENSKVL